MKKILFLCLLAYTSNSFAQRVVLDQSFGDSGMVSGKGMHFNQKIVPLPDGKILCLGEYLNNLGSMQPALLKFDSNGILDTTFNGDGILQDSIVKINSLPFQYPPSNFMSVQPDGRIYMAGSTRDDPFFNTLISCNDSNGNPILSFGKDGVLMLDTIENLYRAFLVGFSSLSNNEIIGCWMGYYKNGYGYILSKFDSTGCVDRSFGTDGILHLKRSNFIFDNMIVLKDESILLSGSDGPNVSSVLIKLNPDATFNNDFGIDGKVIMDVDTLGRSIILHSSSGPETARSVVELEDHRLVVTSITGRNKGDYILRLMPDGSLDKSFGKNGISEGLTHIYDIAVLKDGSIIACNDQYFNHFFPNGIVDSSAQAKFPLSIICVAIQNDNKILFGDFGYYDSNHIFPFIVRLTNDSTVIVPVINAQTNDVSIFQIPFSNAITFSSNNSVIQKITIYDLNGKCVLSKSVADKSFTLNVELANGVYLCKIVTSKGLLYHKLVSF